MYIPAIITVYRRLWQLQRKPVAMSARSLIEAACDKQLLTISKSACYAAVPVPTRAEIEPHFLSGFFGGLKPGFYARQQELL